MSWSDAVIEYFRAHAIDQAIAAQVGVLERNSCLVFPYQDADGAFERVRKIGGKTRQPSGRPLCCWWPTGRPERLETVLVCEGESDVLAALTAVRHASDPVPKELLGALTVVAVPGASFPADRLAEELCGAELVILAPDADQAGDAFAERAAAALRIARIVPVRLPLRGGDLADALAAVGADGSDWLANTIADLRAANETEPGEPMNTAHLLSNVAAFLRRFIVLPSDGAATALALFVLHTWTIDAAEQTPYLLVTSPERQSGKTRLLEVLELIVRAPWRVAGASEAALFRKIEQDSPTLLLDEVDAIFGSNSERVEPLRCLLNAGNRRGACVSRVVGEGKKMAVADFTVYGAKMLAGIATTKLPDTLTDRSLAIQMQRRQSGERVERFRWRHANRDAEPIRAALEQWAASAVETLQDAEPDLPEDLSDRQMDAWEPLLAIADDAAGDWPANARRAALALSTTAEEVGHGAQLLAAIKTAMEGRETIWTSDLLRAINVDDELPFGGWRNGSGLDARSLARLLKPYGVKPRTVRLGAETAKGYATTDLREAWARYLSADSRHTVTRHAQPTENASENGRCDGVTYVSANPGSDGSGSGNGTVDADTVLDRVVEKFGDEVLT